MGNHAVTAVDLAKSVFEIAVSIQPGRVCERRRLPRSRFLTFFATRPTTTVVMEACGSSHHWARKLQELGHSVVLLPPSLVRPYVQRNKTDRTDAKGILEAYRNEEIQPVPIKSIYQQTLTSIHRARSAWVEARTARINTLRGLLRELGQFIPMGAKKVVPAVWLFLEDVDGGCPDGLRPVLARMCAEVRELEASIRDAEAQLERLAKDLPVVAQLRTIPGIGLITATALVAFVGDVRRFKNGRRLASYLGLTPKESSSGTRRRLGRISKQGDPYLRHLLIHGARSMLRAAATKKEPDRLRSWALSKAASRGKYKATVAVANKLARICWAVWARNTEYRAA
jgi:transposase